MRDSRSIEAECGVQPRFSKIAPLAIMLPPLCVLLFAWLLALTPDRRELGPRTAGIELEPVRLDAAGFAPLRLAGAWTLTSDDPRLGGVSALAVDQGRLLAITDSGVLVRMSKPGSRQPSALLGELPDGPGDARFKRHRDSEALVRDPVGRGWWVGFEKRHELWLYDRIFSRALQRIELPAEEWGTNSGIEALAADGPDLLAFPEPGRSVLRIRGSRAVEMPLNGREGPVSEAANLPDGGVVLIERRLTWRGFRSALVMLERDGDGYRATVRFPLPLGPIDNPEALAVEPLAGGALRLWLATDDNYQRPQRTLLVALELRPPRPNRVGRTAPGSPIPRLS
jgi:hypothetical protein